MSVLIMPDKVFQCDHLIVADDKNPGVAESKYESRDRFKLAGA
ncbi:MAG: hypothetical protein V7K40_03670 [Nostoc sp.]